MLPARENDPVLLMLTRIRGQLDEVMNLVRTEKRELDKRKGLGDNADGQR